MYRVPSGSRLLNSRPPRVLGYQPTRNEHTECLGSLPTRDAYGRALDSGQVAGARPLEGTRC